MKKGPTQKDIARALGISPVTVQRALNESGYVSDKLRARIFEQMRKTDYVPHKLAQGLVRKKARRIALFFYCKPAFFWNDILRGIRIASEKLEQFGYEVECHCLQRIDTAEYVCRVRKVVERGVDGVAVVNQAFFDMTAIFRCLDERAVRYITFNIDAPSTNRLCYVGPAYREGGRLAGEFLGKLLRYKKRARLSVITRRFARGSTSRPDINQERLKGFLSVIERDFPSLSVDVLVLSYGMKSAQLRQELRRSLGTVRPDGIYLILPIQEELIGVLRETGQDRDRSIVIHDLSPSIGSLLQQRQITGVIYQNPILQGYYAVMLLERIIDSRGVAEWQNMEISHTLVLNENRTLARNHYFRAKTPLVLSSQKELEESLFW